MNFTKFVINLESRTDRKAEMQRQLAKVGWNAEFIKAIRPDTAADFPSIGALGCFLSHIETLRRGAGSNIILMEDDLSFVRDFADLWPRAVAELPDEWSIFYPAHEIGAGLINPSTGVICAHMIVFRSTIIPRIIRELETIMARPGGHPLGGPMHVDGAYSTIRAQSPDIRTYACAPSLGYQRSSKSDITPVSFGGMLIRPITRLINSLRY